MPSHECKLTGKTLLHQIMIYYDIHTTDHAVTYPVLGIFQVNPEQTHATQDKLHRGNQVLNHCWLQDRRPIHANVTIMPATHKFVISTELPTRGQSEPLIQELRPVQHCVCLLQVHAVSTTICAWSAGKTKPVQGPKHNNYVNFPLKYFTKQDTCIYIHRQFRSGLKVQLQLVWDVTGLEITCMVMLTGPQLTTEII